MSGFGILLRVLAVLVLLRLAVRFIAHVLAGMRGEPAVPASALVRDRVCNTFLPRERALVALVHGREEHFCSTTCRDRALLLQPNP
ncbi:MAG TPA: hypothetical protein VMT87_06695 [Vicinamibacteria bacterium]|nr:hypothetical protein [Vicinamibacteria bacterium]